jgi:hypothetical protein
MAAKESKKEVKKEVKKDVKKDTKKEVKEVKDIHVLSFYEGKGWGVKRQGSDKIIKYFKTKVEATEYIVKVAGNQGTSVSIKLKNGKFQKFDNALRALSYAKTSKEDD